MVGYVTIAVQQWPAVQQWLAMQQWPTVQQGTYHI